MALNSNRGDYIDDVSQEIWGRKKNMKFIYQTLWSLRKKLDIDKRCLCLKKGKFTVL